MLPEMMQPKELSAIRGTDESLYPAGLRIYTQVSQN